MTKKDANIIKTIMAVPMQVLNDHEINETLSRMLYKKYDLSFPTESQMLIIGKNEYLLLDKSYPNGIIMDYYDGLHYRGKLSCLGAKLIGFSIYKHYKKNKQGGKNEI